MLRNVAVVVSLAACSSSADDLAPTSASEPPANLASAPAPEIVVGRPIVTIRARGEELRVLSTPDGLRFAVLDERGRVVSAALTSEELALRHEHLDVLYRRGWARGEPFLDARLDEDAPRDLEAPRGAGAPHLDTRPSR